MIRKPLLLRVTAFFLLLNTLNYIFLPTLTYALTAGPTAPEATSFEPVDTTDMVNLLSGDFAYNIPLLEVPGPEGGYPLALSYHAGIQPNEEASWVGLGWSLNPGAITRNVNGYPDDHENVSNLKRDYWSGGQTSTYSVGVTVGAMNTPASVSAGLSFSQDTYQGFGVGGYTSVGPNFEVGNVSIHAGMSVAVSPYGGRASGGIDIGANAGGLSAGASLTTNAGFSANVGLFGTGASLRSDGSMSYNIGGNAISISNNNAGKISTDSYGFSFTVPINPVLGISLGYNNTRYWSDESQTVATNGVLYNLKSAVTVDDLDNKAFDSYYLMDPSQNVFKPEENDPERKLGGSFPNYDNYQVTAQGLSGSMRPYALQSWIYRQNRKDVNGYIVKQNIIGSGNYDTKPVQFRFIHEFSNKYRYDGGTVVGTSASTSPISASFANPAPETGVYDPNNNHLAGTKHVKWYTNQQINSGAAKTEGFVDCQISGFNKLSTPYSQTYSRPANSQIGGFMITNASGVTYHYALPAYSYSEMMYTTNITKAEGDTYNKLSKPEKYAYTWYLTAVTGPDYLDRGGAGNAGNGLLDEQDWGYWVSFDYGQWASTYGWRNPSEGYRMDLDNNFKSYSAGLKEVYYLDAIKTRTHTALFEKELRNDGLGSTNPELGGFEQMVFPPENGLPSVLGQPATPSLRLNKIHLLNNRDAVQYQYQKYLSTDYTLTYDRGGYPEDPLFYTFGKNVLDKADIDLVRSSLENSDIRMIEFKYDYSLCPEVSNNFNINGINEKGKLTLKEVKFRGKSGASLIPSTKFEYDLPASTVATVNITPNAIVGGTPGSYVNDLGNRLQAGDLIAFTMAGNIYYGVMLATSVAQTYFLKPLGKNVLTGSYSGIQVRLTKNPPYQKDFYDMWGLYKSDYMDTGNENVSRYPTAVSAKSLDAWSLRKVTTPLGADIQVGYQPDDYNKSVLSNSYPVTITNFIRLNSTSYQITVNTAGGLVLPALYKVGDKLEAFYLAYGPNGTGMADPLPARTYKATSLITAVGDNYIQMQDASLISQMDNAGFGGTKVAGGNLKVNTSYNTAGGGIRVGSLAIREPSSGMVTTTTYQYSKPGGSMSSGVTASEPVIMDNYNLTFEDIGVMADAANKQAARDLYRRDLNGKISAVVANAREAPAPGVMYEYVKVGKQITYPSNAQVTYPGFNTYQFEVFNEGMVGLTEKSRYTSTDTQLSGSASGLTYTKVETRSIALKDYLSRLGNIKRMTQYDGEDNKIVETTNNYLHDGLDGSYQSNAVSFEALLSPYNYQGVVQETFIDSRIARFGYVFCSNGCSTAYGYSAQGIVTKREEYPSIQTGTTTRNYKTGLTQTTTNQAFDFYSGEVTQSLSTDGYGNRFLQQSIPAYTVSQSAKMGLKVSNSSNRQMLSQQAGSYVWKVDAGNVKQGLVSATIQTWSDQNKVLIDGTAQTQANIWRQQAAYNWLPTTTTTDGLTPLTGANAFTDFNWAAGAAQATGWQKTGEVTLYNNYSAALEAKDVNSNYAATKMGDNYSRVYASASLANYSEIAYSGAEDALVASAFSGGVGVGSGSSVNLANAHTGASSLSVAANGTGFKYISSYDARVSTWLNKGRAYRASVWVKGNDATQAKLYYKVGPGGAMVYSTNTPRQANGWYLLTLDIPAPGTGIADATALEIGCVNPSAANVSYFDDFRFQPMQSSLTTYVYDPFSGELTHILDNNNLFTRFEYDAAGRLVKTYREAFGYGVKQVSENSYHYARGTN